MKGTESRPRRCKWCGDLVVALDVMVGKDARHRRVVRMWVDVEPHPFGTVVESVEHGWIALRKRRLPANGEGRRIHGAGPCAAIGVVDVEPMFTSRERMIFELVRKALMDATEGEPRAVAH